MKRLAVASLFACYALSGCASTPKETTTLPQVSALVIKEPTFENTALIDMDEEEKVRFEAIKPALKRALQDNLVKEIVGRGYLKEVSIDKTDAADPLVMQCNFNRFEFGNRALRYFFWFGNKTKTEIKCDLIAKNKIIKSKTEDDDTGGPFRWSSPESYFIEMTEQIAGQAADIIDDYMQGS